MSVFLLNDLRIPSLPFVVDAEGRFGPDRVLVHFEPAERPTTPELERLIEVEWEKQMTLAKAADRLLFNGPLLRYVSHHSQDGRFEMTVGPTCYRDFVGTNLFNHHHLDRFGWQSFSNPVGTTATLITADGKVCYGRRSSRVSYHADHIHTFGGAFEEADRLANGSIDPFASVSREITEELNIASDELRDLVCVGLLRDKEIYQPELLFEARLDLDEREIVDRWQGAEAKDEHSGLEFFGDTPDEIIRFIKECGLIAPVASGALFLHGLHSWGLDWYSNAALALTDHW